MAKMWDTLVRMLLVGFDEAAVGHGDTGLVGIDELAIGRAADGDQHHVVDLRLVGRLLAFEGDVDAVLLGLDRDGLGFQHDVIEAAGVDLLPDLDEVAVGPGHQAVEHLDAIEPGAERRIDGCHFEADDAAADDEHLLGDVAQFERAGRIDDARVFGNEG